MEANKNRGVYQANFGRFAGAKRTHLVADRYFKGVIQICSRRLAAALKSIHFRPFFLSAKRGDLERKTTLTALLFIKLIYSIGERNSYQNNLDLKVEMSRFSRVALLPVLS